MSRVTLYSASAGTGKTYTICAEIAARVEKGLDARRLLACTFTKKAAAELKSRVQESLLKKGLAEAASALDLAPIGTVHSVGHRFVSRFALKLGLSPDLAVMPEGGDIAALKNIVDASGSPAWGELVALEGRLAVGGMDEDEGGREPTLLKLLRLKRQNAIPDVAFKEQMSANAKRFIQVLGGPRGRGDFATAVAEAQRHAEAAIKALGRIAGDGHKDAQAHLSRIVRFGARTWYELAKLAELDGGKDKAVHKALEEVWAFGANLRHHPGLGADCTRYLELLAEQGIAVEQRYQTYKRERGLLDYTDMEAYFHRLVSDPAFADALRAEVDLVVVDEFQDTNPVQLAIFQGLSRLAPETIWVGDYKQTIYAFNGAAPDLMSAVWNDRGVNKKTLETNRRSAKGVVDVANLVFSPVFGEESRMKHHEPAQAETAERWLLVSKNNDGEAAALAQALSDFLTRSKRRRSEVAILVRTNTWGSAVAGALQAAGIPAALAVGGLLSTRQCAAVLAGLRFVADRYDSLAAATIIHHLEQAKGTPPWLDARLAELKEKKGSKPFEGHPVLARLELLDPKVLSPRAAVVGVIEALGLTARVGDWTEPARRASDFDALLSEVDAYEESALGAGRSATLTGLIVHLESLEEGGGDKREPPRGLDAVQILTYHRSKGLEWPVVVLTQLDKRFAGTPFEPSVSGGDPAKGKPLHGRQISFWPHPFNGTKALGLKEDAEQTPEGQAAAAIVAAEEQRLLYVGFTRPKELLVLATRVSELKAGDSHKHKWLDGLPSFAATLGGPTEAEGKHKISHIAGSVRVIRVQPGVPGEVEQPTKQSWLPKPPAKLPEVTPRYRHPSEEPGKPAEFTLEPLPGGPAFKGPPIGIEPEDMGNAFHAYFSALPSLNGDKVRVAARILEGFGLSGKVAPADLVTAGQRLEGFVAKRFPGARWLTEVPVSAPDGKGAQWDGSIDLLLELQDGSVAVLDHKSFFGKEAHVKERAAEHAGQLSAYSAALKGVGRKVNSVGLHLPLAGQAAFMGVA